MWLTLGSLTFGLVLLLGGGELLVRGGSRLAGALGLTPLIIGLTVVAFGTSAPELAVSVKAAWQGRADIAVGNVVGSNIANVAGILGLCALIKPLAVKQALILRDAPVMVGASFVMYFLALDGAFGRLEGALLAAALVVYSVFSIKRSKEAPAVLPAGLERGSGGAGQLVLFAAMVVGGLAFLALGADLCVQAASDLARQLGVSELTIALTIVAIGTSLPEIAASVIATIHGEHDIAIGNLIGSNIFNILSVLGITALTAPVAVSQSVLGFDLPVMLVISVTAWLMVYSGNTVSRREGAVLLLTYLLYLGHAAFVTSG